jgi:8-oxo-dGTP diphosphatase
VSDSRLVRAAGGVVVRLAPGGSEEVLLVHRPRYDDWSLPKGKLDRGESFEAAAVREVEEETGLRCRLGREIGETRYTDSRGRPKVVRYWRMEPDGAASAFVPNAEVDELQWVPLPQAVRLLSYVHDRELLERVGTPSP